MIRFSQFLLLLILMACGQEPPESEPGLAQMLAADELSGFQRAELPRTFRFPEDHGAHDGFRNEWWYLTGNLADAGGREFGYQFTVFRIALSPEKPVGESRWNSRYVWMGHAAISDISTTTHLQTNRFSREVEGLAGITSDPLLIQLEDWHLRAMDRQNGNSLPWHVSANGDGFAFSLKVDPLKPLVLQGDLGLSRKGPGEGNASYYYSHTRLDTTGSIQIGQETFEVSGQSWLDREWSTSVLDTDQQGWDWFSLQLDDGRDLMFYQIRKKTGEADPHSAGVLVDRNGKPEHLSSSDVKLIPVSYWDAPSGARYPVEWLMQIEEEPQAWIVSARFNAQEMRTLVDYWEGAIRVTGAETGKNLGKGYLEMTGY